MIFHTRNLRLLDSIGQGKKMFGADRNLLKINPPSKIRPPPFLNEVFAKGTFLSKVRPPIYAAVHAVMLSKKHQRSSSKADMHAPLHKQAHDKRGIAEPLHAQITRARPTACEVGVFLRELSTLKNTPTPSFRSHLSSSPMGLFSRDYGTRVVLKLLQC